MNDTTTMRATPDMAARRQMLLRHAKPATIAQPETVVASPPESVAATTPEPEPPKPTKPAKAGHPHPQHLRAFRLRAGDRPIILDRRAVSFVCPEVGREDQTVIGLKLLGARPVVVTSTFEEVVAWWLGSDAPPIPPPTAQAKESPG